MASEQPSQPNPWTFRRVMWATSVFVLIAFSFWLLYRFYQVVFILFVAIVISTVIRPLVTWLQRRGVSQTAGIILVYTLLLVLLIGFITMLVPLIVEQGATIASAVPGYYQGLREGVVNSPNLLIRSFGDFLPVTLPKLEPVQQTGLEFLTFAGQAFNYLSLTANIIFMFTAILLLVFHWTLSGPRTIQSLLRLVPLDKRESISDLITAMESKVGSYIIGQSILCLAIGILALVAYLIIGLPNALVLALVAGIMEAIPMIGPFLGAIPAGVIALSISPSKLIWVVVSTLVIQQLESSFLVPRVMRKAVGVNPFVSLLAIFAFSTFFGIPGALMAIPMAAIIQLLLDRFVFHPAAMEPELQAGRDYASRLRYEAQALVQDLRKQARINKSGSVTEVKNIDQVMDEIEAISTDLDSLLIEVPTPGEA